MSETKLLSKILRGDSNFQGGGFRIKHQYWHKNDVSWYYIFYGLLFESLCLKITAVNFKFVISDLKYSFLEQNNHSYNFWSTMLDLSFWIARI